MRNLIQLLPKLKESLTDRLELILFSLHGLSEHAQEIARNSTTFEVNKGIAEYVNSNGMAQIWVENFCFATQVIVDDNSEFVIQLYRATLDKDHVGKGVHDFYKVYDAEEKEILYVALTYSDVPGDLIGFCIITDERSNSVCNTERVYYHSLVTPDTADAATVAVHGIIALEELLSSKTTDNPSQ